MKIWTEQEIVEMLKNSDHAVERAILAIYNRQTESEKNVDAAIVDNGIGFSGADASSGSYIAKWILSGRKISGKFVDKARHIAIKYRRQLVSIANG